MTFGLFFIFEGYKSYRRAHICQEMNNKLEVVQLLLSKQKQYFTTYTNFYTNGDIEEAETLNKELLELYDNIAIELKTISLLGARVIE